LALVDRKMETTENKVQENGEEQKSRRASTRRSQRAKSPFNPFLFWKRPGAKPENDPRATRRESVKRDPADNSSRRKTDSSSSLQDRNRELQMANDQLAEYQEDLLATVAAIRDELDKERQLHQETIKGLRESQEQLAVSQAELNDRKVEVETVKLELQETGEKLETITQQRDTAEESIKTLQEVQKRSLAVISEIEAKVQSQHEEASKLLSERTSEIMSNRNDISRLQRDNSLFEGQLQEALKEKELLEKRLKSSRFLCC